MNQVTVLPASRTAPEVEGLYDRAIALIRAAVQTLPGSPRYQSDLALYYESRAMWYWDTNQAVKAEKALRAGIAIHERADVRGRLDRFSERYLGRAYCSLGWLMAARGRFAEAAKAYDQSAELLGSLVKDFPDGVFCRTELIRTRIRQAALEETHSNYSAARDYYRQAVQLDPKSAWANNSLAWLLVACPDPTLRDAHEAVRLAKQAVDANSRSAACWNTLGVAHYRDGHWQSCIETIEKAMKLRNGGDSYDWFFLAMAHWKLGEPDAAHRWLAKAVQWLEQNKNHNRELDRFQSEAQALVGKAAVASQPAQTLPAGK